MMTQKQIDDIIYASMEAYEEPAAFARRIEAAATTAEREACADLFQRLERTEQEIAQHMTAAEAAERERWERAIGAEMPADFKDWHQNAASERPEVAAFLIRCLRADRDSWVQQASDRVQDALDLVDAERKRCLHLARHALSCAKNTEWEAAEDALYRIEWHNAGSAAQPAAQQEQRP